MWHLLNLVNRGHRYHIGGVIERNESIAPFVTKMDRQFDLLIAPSTRTKRHRRKIPTAQLVLYRDQGQRWLWWILFAGTERAVHQWVAPYREALQDAYRTDGRLLFASSYILRQRQKPRDAGGGNAWTWFMIKRVQNAVEKELVYLASSHGRGAERTDDLVRAVSRLRQRPMFNGVRLQASHALRRAKRVWYKTHGRDVSYPPIMDEPLPWFAGRMRIFD